MTSTKLLSAHLKNDDRYLDYAGRFATLFPDGVKSDIDRAKFLLDLMTWREAGFRGEVILELDAGKRVEYQLTDNGVKELTGVVIYEEVQMETESAMVMTASDGNYEQTAARLVIDVGVDDLDKQYAWLLQQAERHRTDFPEPLIGLLEFYEGMRELIREADPLVTENGVTETPMKLVEDVVQISQNTCILCNAKLDTSQGDRIGPMGLGVCNVCIEKEVQAKDAEMRCEVTAND